MGLFHQVSGQIETVPVLKRLAHVISLGSHKCISHAAANEDDISLFHEVGNNLDFITDFSPADNGCKRSFRMFDDTIEKINFLL